MVGQLLTHIPVHVPEIRMTNFVFRTFFRLNNYFKFGAKTQRSVFEDIVIKMIWMFNTLEHLLIYDDLHNTVIANRTALQRTPDDIKH